MNYHGTLQKDDLITLVHFFFSEMPAADLEEMLGIGKQPPRAVFHTPEAIVLRGELIMLPHLREPVLLRRYQIGLIRGISFHFPQPAARAFEIYEIDRNQAEALYTKHVPEAGGTA